MPPCKNSTGYYTGREPSPKGLGYCAHSEGVGARRVGNDGWTWIVQRDRLGRLAWKKYMKNTGTPARNYARRTPGTPKRTKTPGTTTKRAKATSGTPRCRPDQIVNPRTNRCVSRNGKIGLELRNGYGGDLWTKQRQKKYPTARRTQLLLSRNGYQSQDIPYEELDQYYRYMFDGIN